MSNATITINDLCKIMNEFNQQMMNAFHLDEERGHLLADEAYVKLTEQLNQHGIKLIKTNPTQP
jgi:hypothetical protein